MTTHRRPPRRPRTPAAPAAAPAPAFPRHVSELTAIDSRLPSPDGRFELVRFDPFEYRMGWTCARVALADASGAVVETFGGLWAETQDPGTWSQDSEWLAFRASSPVTSGGESRHAFLILAWNVTQARFGAVLVGNPYPLGVSLPGSRAIRLEIRADQVAAAGSTTVFGGETAEFPVPRFRAPEPVEIAFGSLGLHSRDELARLPEILSSARVVSLKLVPDGWSMPDGPGLTSTRQRLNGRPLEVHHLEAFAAAGDALAQEWLSEARRLRGAALSPWEAVAPILGDRSREP